MMATTPFRPPARSRAYTRAVAHRDATTGLPRTATSLRPLTRLLLLPGGVLLITLLGMIDYQTGPDLAVAVLYLIPVGFCAWWGGFAHGTLLAVFAAVAWGAVEWAERPEIQAAAVMWNGVLRFGTLALVSSLVSRFHAGVVRERWLALTDPLTGAANGRHFYEVAADEAERALRDGHPLTVAYFDLDDFKQVNDRMGHAAGDEVLLFVAHTVQSRVGALGLLARLGGDEFALVLPGLTATEVSALLARTHAEVSEGVAGRGWPVSLSIGAATFPSPTWDVDRLVQRADTLMYGAKRKGKRRVEHAIVDCAGEPRKGERRRGERRATARVLSFRTARVRPQGVESPGAFAIVRNVSAGGLALHLDACYPEDTVLVVEPLAPGARTLLARVVRITAEAGGWVHGCALSTQLSEEEVHSWADEQAEPADPPDALLHQS